MSKNLNSSAVNSNLTAYKWFNQSTGAIMKKANQFFDVEDAALDREFEWQMEEEIVITKKQQHKNVWLRLLSKAEQVCNWMGPVTVAFFHFVLSILGIKWIVRAGNVKRVAKFFGQLFYDALAILVWLMVKTGRLFFGSTKSKTRRRKKYR